MRSVLALLVLLLSVSAEAKWKPEYADLDPKIKEFYHDSHNAKGEWCCDESDGHPYYGNIDFHPDGSITVYRDGQSVTLPDYMVLRKPNPTGHAVWWYNSVRDYCFALGTAG